MDPRPIASSVEASQIALAPEQLRELGTGSLGASRVALEIGFGGAELLLALDTAIFAMKNGDRHKCMDRQTRALAILHALETSLDHERGGDIAINLAVIYREVRKRTLNATAANDPAPMEASRGFIADIAGAWNQIG